MDLKLEGKSAVVLASSKGIGRAIAQELAAEGANVLISSRSDKNLKKATEEISRTSKGEVYSKTCDISSSDSIKSLIQYGVDQFGTVDILVNNSGGPPKGNFDDVSDSDWSEAHDSTFLSYVRAIREVLPYMIENGEGRILNTASSSIKQPINNLLLSNVYRNALVGLTKSLQTELAPHNILINILGPGKINTDRQANTQRKYAEERNVPIEEIQKDTLKNIPIGRLGKPEEFAKMAVFLCSGANTYITGQSFLVDGGLVKSI